GDLEASQTIGMDVDDGMQAETSRTLLEDSREGKEEEEEEILVKNSPVHSQDESRPSISPSHIFVLASDGEDEDLAGSPLVLSQDTTIEEATAEKGNSSTPPPPAANDPN